VQFQVAAFQPTGSFAAMAAGEAEIVQSSRKVLHSEAVSLRTARGKDYVELQVATEIAGIAINKANPVKELSLFQLRQVLSGTVTNWKRVGGADAPITIYGRSDTSGVRAFLEEEFMGDEAISASTKTFGSNSGMIAAVSHDANGIGFGDIEGGLDPQVRFVAIKPSANADAVAPTEDAIRAKRYKLTRPLFFYFAGAPSGDLLRFAEWILSPEGQLVVESVGYFPLTSAERETGRQALKDEK
jgi:phosphate transport system substrate-binding protein